MNEGVYKYYIIDRAHRALRVDAPELKEEFARLGLCPEERMVRRFELLTSMEKPAFVEGERIVFRRTVRNLPDVFTEEEWYAIRKDGIHENGYVSNVTPDYSIALSKGLLAMRESADVYGRRMIDALLRVSDGYLAEARRLGREDLTEVLSHVPRYPARSFREALQLLRIVHYSLWLEGNYHITVGRFDQYMLPYLKGDLDSGVLTEEEALELLEDFFLSFNKDSDLYNGIQQGDNGQSMVLGGIDRRGRDCFNILSRLCLIASRNLKLIDPKINLRVSRDTDPEIFRLGTELTAVGLGFPQYSNDDVVIPALVEHGYELADARDYVVAACWEFIIPSVGDDVNNVADFNCAGAVNTAVRRFLSEGGDSRDLLLSMVKEQVTKELDGILSAKGKVWFVPSPLMSRLRPDLKYFNYGMHGCGLATAVDQIVAVCEQVIGGRVEHSRLIEALDTNFERDPELFHLLRYETPKLGDGKSGDSRRTLEWLMDVMADAVSGKPCAHGGVWRMGTGTAMYYIWHAQQLGATADGRLGGEPFGANFSPSLFADISSPFSVIRDFTPRNIGRCINGGPLTMEIASSVFRAAEGVDKVAALVRGFILAGGHQLQLNSVDPDKLRAAMEDPDSYRQLIVRIWGWSAYFVELDREFREHVLRRQEYAL